jgi:hypothetical protein
MDSFADSAYSGTITARLIVPRLPQLGPGQANAAAKAGLEQLTTESVFAPAGVYDHDMAMACLAGIWLYHDFLEESHRISQEIATPSGSFWHAIMHRREPDAWNSKYWFRRVGTHPIFEPLREKAEQLPGAKSQGSATTPLFRQPHWDPYAFVDLCELARERDDGLAKLCQQIQALEWRLLFDFCCRRALEKPH